MALIEPPIDEVTLDAFRRVVAALLPSGDASIGAIQGQVVSDPLGGGATPAPPPPPQTPVTGHRVFALGALGLSRGSTETRYVGWQCLTASEIEAIAGDVRPGSTNFSGKRGAAVDKARAGHLALAQLTQAQDLNLEVRVLRIPEFRFEAFWLKNPPFDNATLGVDDLIYPYLSFLPNLLEGRVVNGNALVHQLRPLASEQVKAAIVAP